MTITITLDAETEKAIERKAARLHISPAACLERLARRSASRPVKQAAEPEETPARRLKAIVERADPDELKAHGITLPKYPAKTGAELIANLEAAGLMNGFGDPNIDSPELARQLREKAQTRAAACANPEPATAT
jgi:hypothetical protein